MRVLGIDPGLRNLGWGVIDVVDTTYHYIASGTICVPTTLAMAQRLGVIFTELSGVIRNYRPSQAAVEEIFVNMNPASTLKLGMARGVALMVPAVHDIPVSEYTANHIKKAIVGSGHASKDQINTMVRHFLPRAVNADGVLAPDAADALAVALCHVHALSFQKKAYGS
ncbi:MAG: crossover junction endodeoxyribonuclease RuvC [Alphaproteobacteria bacterium]|nr:MAG: crossover junction endodeoxyribonuclease RuvC [Alphaproteobacteria bacterium]